MSTDAIKERVRETSPQVYARIGGVLYLIIIVIGFCSQFFVRDKLVVSGDVTATANNIMASESLWRISIASELLLPVCAVALTLILAPTYAATIFPILVLALTGELSLCLWLMVKGVNVPKWDAKARLADLYS